MVSGYFPYVSDLKKFLDFQAETPKEFIPDVMPCSCSKEKLVALKGQECEHGTRWGLGALREILKPEEIAELPKVDISDRRKVLQEQAGRK